ncbi:MAG: hypothetical protein JWM17_3031 [Actinobacteria bacterium]|nr:hypothetical protein [Actinomycetota bacterium]MCW3043790.1 hypothetical protein [Actinomycetota bacterium]MEA2504271.1 hypothetical protein [Actinomycetota bacterium]MEA2589003.1 hypothetical protein [Actinomycetota bacterium]MEA2591321.1 hypothetical protein [Actinomycetota bacterium]
MPVQTETVVRELKKWGMSLPSLGKLVVALMADPRVPRMNKIVVGGIAAYLVTPVGMVPRRLLGLKRINELILPVIAIDVLLSGASDEVLRDHWHGDPEVLKTIRGLARRGSALAPARVRRVFGSVA